MGGGKGLDWSTMNNMNYCVLCPVLFVCQDIEVEYEFLRVLEDTKMKRANFVCKYGPVMRAGNTLDDIGKPAIDPFNKKKEPVVILQEHIIVNDVRLVDILKRYDPTGAFSVTPEDFMAALEVRSSSHCCDHACSFATCCSSAFIFHLYFVAFWKVESLGEACACTHTYTHTQLLPPPPPKNKNNNTQHHEQPESSASSQQPHTSKVISYVSSNQ